MKSGFRAQRLTSQAWPYLIGVSELKLPSVPGPADEWLAGFVGEQFQEKLPQLNRSTAWVEGWITLWWI